MARTRKRVTLEQAQAALTPAPPHGRADLRRCHALRDAAQAEIAAGEWSAVLALRAWAAQHPLFRGPDAFLRGFLRRWEEALLSGAPLELAATLVRDDVPTATHGPWDRLAARATWAELRPLLCEDAAAWSVAEGRVLRGEALRGRSPYSGMPLRLAAWEPAPALPHYTVAGASWSVRGFESAPHPVALPPAPPEQPHEPAWDRLLAPWSGYPARVVKVDGTAEQALACLLDQTRVHVAACSEHEALGALMQMHGDPAPYTEGRGMVAARRMVWRLLAELAGVGWPASAAALRAATTGWRWWHYDPHEPDAVCSLYLALEDPRRTRAWAVHAWATD